MHKFSFVEDYLEILAGYTPKVNNNHIIFNSGLYGFKLARYDINIVNNMATSTSFGTALTDRQAELAVKLVLKYRRQFASHNIDISPVEKPTFRLPVRTVNREKTIKLNKDKIEVNFLYDKTMIDQLQGYKQTSLGSVYFDRVDKIWYLAPTENNVQWILDWAESYNFTIDPQLFSFLDQINKVLETPYEIKLIKGKECYDIENGEETLKEYINKNLGGFAFDNWLTLIDYASILGYTVDDLVFLDKRIKLSYSERSALEYLGTKRNPSMAPNSTMLNWVFEYAKLTDRFPICIYDPHKIITDLSMFSKEDIVRFDRNSKTSTCDYNPYTVKIVYAEKIPQTWDYPIPLLVTTFEMMYGHSRSKWVKNAEKIVYYTESKLRTN